MIRLALILLALAGCVMVSVTTTDAPRVYSRPTVESDQDSDQATAQAQEQDQKQRQESRQKHSEVTK